MPRLIDANALMEYCNNQKDKTIDANDIARFPAIGGWISVNDGLPEEHADEHPYEFEQYLCVTVWNYVRTIGFGTRIGDDKPHFWSGNTIWDDRVTHWMPLPEPPKEDE